MTTSFSPPSWEFLRTPDITPVRDAHIGFGLWPWSKGPLWRLEERHGFWVRVRDDLWIRHEIPAGYEFDKASVPAVFWGFPFNYTPDGLCTVPALEHDFLCDIFAGGSDWLREQLGADYPVKLPAEVIHRHFYERLNDWSVRPSKSKTMYAGVRNLGPGGRLRPSSWFRRAASLAALLVLPSCAGDIAGLSREERLTLYGGAAMLAGKPELAAVAYALRKPSTAAKQPREVAP
jgi:hypothetical protein